MAEMLEAIDEYDELNYHHHRRIAFVDSFLLDFRALYYFLLGPREKGDAHRFDFVDIKTWQRPKTEATKRMGKLVLFISKHRAHLSMSRFDPPYPDLEEWIGVPSITAEYLAQVLLDYLDILDEFIAHLPEGKESGKGFGMVRPTVPGLRLRLHSAYGSRRPNLSTSSHSRACRRGRRASPHEARPCS
jgi:hypothetical protein